MEIIEKYPIQIEKWHHSDEGKFFGKNTDNGYHFILGITPEDKKEKGIYYFNVWIEKKIENEVNGVVFHAKTYNCFKVKLDEDDPTSSFYFDLIESATSEFAQLFHYNTKGTNLQTRRIKKPTINHFEDDILKAIEIWKKDYKTDENRKKPDWQESFRDLPKIPSAKKWTEDSYDTKEQSLTIKLFQNQLLSEEEMDTLECLKDFYAELAVKLKKLDYNSFSEEDFENFKNYIFYAFNYTVLITNGLSIYSTYRLVVNEWVTGKDEALTDIKYLKYPPLEVIEKYGKFGRANTSKTNVFYSTDSIDTSLKELQPPTNKLITVGVWKLKDKSKKLISYPISHSSQAIVKNFGVRKANDAFSEMKFDQLLKSFMQNYFEVLGSEYSKEVANHIEYFISSHFSERILNTNSIDGEFDVECIIYPSVANDYESDNLAVKPSVVDEHFELVEVIEFKVSLAKYNELRKSNDPDEISLAEVEMVRKARKITDDYIVW